MMQTQNNIGAGGCPRCNGFVTSNRDAYGDYDECLYCGWEGVHPHPDVVKGKENYGASGVRTADVRKWEFKGWVYRSHSHAKKVYLDVIIQYDATAISKACSAMAVWNWPHKQLPYTHRYVVTQVRRAFHEHMGVSLLKLQEAIDAYRE